MLSPARVASALLSTALLSTALLSTAESGAEQSIIPDVGTATCVI